MMGAGLTAQGRRRQGAQEPYRGFCTRPTGLMAEDGGSFSTSKLRQAEPEDGAECQILMNS